MYNPNPTFEEYNFEVTGAAIKFLQYVLQQHPDISGYGDFTCPYMRNLAEAIGVFDGRD